jgi:cytoplasmic iron level regulating protein YaaA (DUF328/UPF0246 family)
MDLSDNLSALNVARYASWTPDPRARQAVMTFNGDVYDGLDARSLKPAQLDYAQSRSASCPACTACCVRWT